MYTETTNKASFAAGWVLKSLYTNKKWFDEIRHAGQTHFERKYHHIPLYDLAQATDNYDIRTLMEACYLLRDKGQVDIWGDDFEPLGMLVQLCPEGELAYSQGAYENKAKKGLYKRAIGALATLTAIIMLVIGINKTIGHKQEKASGPDSNKTKTADIQAKTAAYANSNDNN